MTCKACQLMLDAYVDGELDAREQVLVRAHLAECADCALEMAEIHDLKRALCTSDDCRIPEGLEARLLQNVLGAPELVPASPVRRTGWAVVGLAAAAAIAVALFVRLQHESSLAQTDSPELDEVAFEMARDQAYAAGADPLSGRSGVLSVSYGRR